MTETGDRDAAEQVIAISEMRTSMVVPTDDHKSSGPGQ
jgi:hypothetical protein